MSPCEGELVILKWLFLVTILEQVIISLSVYSTRSNPSLLTYLRLSWRLHSYIGYRTFLSIVLGYLYLSTAFTSAPNNSLLIYCNGLIRRIAMIKQRMEPTNLRKRVNKTG